MAPAVPAVDQRRRLLFANVLADLPAHLARTSRASLMVDTPEYNCHTTGSDALWAGVPILTVAGEQMASRVGRSIGLASGLLGGVVHTLAEFQRVATELLRTPAWPPGQFV